ncbi:MAG: radical SAM family heme chaperone HemW [Acutalibacteraceae bacterium]|nr:radical SAM family heme chaperone HemW [Acutalibacteraceae bacterium]
MTDLGLYLHIPFCKRKCAYCDFYSAVFTEKLLGEYVGALEKSIKEWGGKTNRPISSIYLGGGTPSLLNRKLIPLLSSVRESFKVDENAEITLEINPTENIAEVLENAKLSGVNRLSLGAQSGNDRILKILGRTHTAQDTENAVKVAKELGFSNISLDLMLGLPDSDLASLKQDLDFLLKLNPSHISCYILKIEPATKFYKAESGLNLPSEDGICDQYLFMCDYLRKHGFSHYEISNFCKDGKKSRHNLKYWQCREYIGIGPSAHSFLDGKRFYYPRDLKGFIKGNSPIFDGFGGDKTEQIMLGLRLDSGIDFDILPPDAQKKCAEFAKRGLGILKDNRFSLTDKGMLLSNAIITEILEDFE